MGIVPQSLNGFNFKGTGIEAVFVQTRVLPSSALSLARNFQTRPFAVSREKVDYSFAPIDVFVPAASLEEFSDKCNPLHSDPVQLVVFDTTDSSEWFWDVYILENQQKVGGGGCAFRILFKIVADECLRSTTLNTETFVFDNLSFSLVSHSVDSPLPARPIYEITMDDNGNGSYKRRRYLHTSWTGDSASGKVPVAVIPGPTVIDIAGEIAAGRIDADYGDLRLVVNGVETPYVIGDFSPTQKIMWTVLEFGPLLLTQVGEVSGAPSLPFWLNSKSSIENFPDSGHLLVDANAEVLFYSKKNDTNTAFYITKRGLWDSTPTAIADFANVRFLYHEIYVLWHYPNSETPPPHSFDPEADYEDHFLTLNPHTSTNQLWKFDAFGVDGIKKYPEWSREVLNPGLVYFFTVDEDTGAPATDGVHEVVGIKIIGQSPLSGSSTSSYVVDAVIYLNVMVNPQTVTITLGDVSHLINPEPTPPAGASDPTNAIYGLVGRKASGEWEFLQEGAEVASPPAWTDMPAFSSGSLEEYELLGILMRALQGNVSQNYIQLSEIEIANTGVIAIHRGPQKTIGGTSLKLASLGRSMEFGYPLIDGQSVSMDTDNKICNFIYADTTEESRLVYLVFDAVREDWLTLSSGLPLSISSDAQNDVTLDIHWRARRWP